MKRKGLDLLTAREREVFDHSIRGRSNVEIAKILSISVKTVETHRNKTNRKLGVRSPAALILYALRVGALTREMVT